MATTSDMRPGQAVYRPFKPQAPGIVLSNEPSQNPRYRRVRVLWSDATTSDEVLLPHGLNDLEALMDDHRRKLATHEAALAKLRAMALAR